jgi:hypothetical protein
MELNGGALIYFSCYSKNGKMVRFGFGTVSKLLLTIKDNLSNDNEEEKSQKPLFFHFKVTS